MKNLRDARNEAGLTQKKLAQMVGISQQSYSDYENDRTFPDEVTFIKIADALNVSTDYLLGRSDDLGAVVMPQQTMQLTEEEENLIIKFRSLRADLVPTLWNVLNSLSDSSETSSKKKA